MTVATRQTARKASKSSSSSPVSFTAGEKVDGMPKKTTRINSKSKEATKQPKKKLACPTEAIDRENTAISNITRPWYHFFTKGDEEYDRYMSSEWGLEKRGTIPLFEKMSLEGAQSGLSWLTILRKRDAYRRVFHGFDIDKVAAMTTSDIDRILAEEDKANPRNLVVRHRGKIESVINNAQCIQRLVMENPDKADVFDEFLWSFVKDQPILNQHWDGSSWSNAVTQSKESQSMSKTLKSMGFRFVGPTTMYAMMQSCGMVIDHPVDSPEWHAAVDRLKKRPGGYQNQVL